MIGVEGLGFQCLGFSLGVLGFRVLTFLTGLGSYELQSKLLGGGGGI